jgi:protein-S-isoprenylcysteine O-methyltransferase Ste14
MSPLSPMRRRAPWVAGAVLLALVGLPLVAAALRSPIRWPYLVGAGAILLLLAGWVERWWQSRPAVRPPSRGRSKARGRFRVVDGGRPDRGPFAGLDEEEDKDDDPKWLM